MPTKKTARAFAIADALIGAYATNNRRDIASMVARIHNVRLMWLKATGASEIPNKLEPDVRVSLNGDGRIKDFKPDAASFLAYLVAHDAHHRGRITISARQLGHPISRSAMFGLWEWGTR
jgi:hypothetical protein